MQQDWLKSVVRVGDGRGFVIETKDERRLVVTAAHCLQRDGQPCLPPADPEPEDRTYPDFLGPLNKAATVWAECVFVDPIVDLAVLGPPEHSDLWEKAEAYNELVGATDELVGATVEELVRVTVPLAVGRLPSVPLTRLRPLVSYAPWACETESEAWLLALDGQHWFSCQVVCRTASRGRRLSIAKADESICGGMSGSPIVAPDGRAIGIVSTSHSGIDESHHLGDSPYLPDDLPARFVEGL